VVLANNLQYSTVCIGYTSSVYEADGRQRYAWSLVHYWLTNDIPHSPSTASLIESNPCLFKDGKV